MHRTQNPAGKNSTVARQPQPATQNTGYGKHSNRATRARKEGAQITPPKGGRLKTQSTSDNKGLLKVKHIRHDLRERSCKILTHLLDALVNAHILYESLTVPLDALAKR